MDTASAPGLLAPGQPYVSRDGRRQTILSVRIDEGTAAPLIFLRDDESGRPSVETPPLPFATQEPQPLYP